MYLLRNTTSTNTAETAHLRRGIVEKDLYVKHMTIPTSFYHITSSRNTLVILEDAVTLTVTIPPGNYSTSTFATTVNDLLDTASAATGGTETYTCSIDPDTYVFTFSTSAGTSNLGPQFASYANLARIMGFAASNTAATATTVSGTTSVFLRATEIACQITGLTNPHYSVDMPGGPFTFVTIKEDAFDVVEWDIGCWAHVTSSERLKITFYDDFGEIVDFNGKLFTVHITDKA